MWAIMPKHTLLHNLKTRFYPSHFKFVKMRQNVLTMMV